jgi:hypothetical protein
MLGSSPIRIANMVLPCAALGAQSADLRTCPIQGNIPSRSYSFTSSPD